MDVKRGIHVMIDDEIFLWNFSFGTKLKKTQEQDNNVWEEQPSFPNLTSMPLQVKSSKVIAKIHGCY